MPVSNAASAQSEAEIHSSATIDLLGSPAHFIEVSGHYRGMGEDSIKEATLLGVLLIGDEKSLFIKMIGPKAQVQAEREAFTAFAKSFRSE